MRCWRFDLRRKLAAYIHDALPADSVIRIEAHLTDCAHCRGKLSELMKADALLSELPPAEPSNDPWPAIETAVTSRKAPNPTRHGTPLHMLASALAAVGILAFLLLWTMLSDKPGDRAVFDPAGYEQTPLADFGYSAPPHVVTEGYVTSVQVNNEDGDLRFKLVDNLGKPNHFVVCEIIPPFKFQPPPAGSRIRVYGVSRYDGKPQHEWFEVHPVLGIEKVPDGK